MLLRGPFIPLIGALGCAIAVLWSSATPGLGTIESAAPPYSDVPAPLEQLTENDSTMVTLRRQASRALAQLQTRKTSAVTAH
jgi:hypothetical protein